MLKGCTNTPANSTDFHSINDKKNSLLFFYDDAATSISAVGKNAAYLFASSSTMSDYSYWQQPM